MPRHSIIIPCYNTERYVAAAVRSCLNQTDKDLEVIVVNDGSTDGSAGVIAAVAKTDKRVRVITQRNKGLGAARNAGLKAAKGKYVNFLDADDLLEPQKLELQGKVLDENPKIGLVLCDMLRVDADDKVIALEYYFVQPGDFSAHRPLAEVLIGRMFAPHVPLVRRELALRIGGFTPSREAAAAADMEFWMSLAFEGADYHMIDQPLVRYRSLPGSMGKDQPLMERAIRAVYLSLIKKYPEGFLGAVRGLQMRHLWLEESSMKEKGWLASQLGEKDKKIEEFWQRILEEQQVTKKAVEWHQEQSRQREEAVKEAVINIAVKHVYIFGKLAGDKKRSIFVWGAGSGGQRVFNLLQRQGSAVESFIDADLEKSGSKVEGVLVHTPQEALTPEKLDSGNFFVLVASIHSVEIEPQLLRLGLQPDKNYFVVDFGIIAKYEDIQSL